ncbi:MAG: hypothetical protein WCJ94_02085 [bacterium]
MASETRLNGLGLNINSVYAPDSWMISDAANVNLFPATILKYPKLAVFEYDGSDLNSYANLDLFGGVIGLYTNTNTYINLLDNSVNSGVLYGRNLSNAISFAVGITYQQYLDKQVQNPTEMPVSYDKDIRVNKFNNAFGINLGLSYLGDIPMDFGLSLVFPLSIACENTFYDIWGNIEQFCQQKTVGIEAKLNGKVNFGDMTIGLGPQLYTIKYENIQKCFNTSGALYLDWYQVITNQSIMIQLGAVKTVKFDKTTIFAGTQVEMNFYNNSWANGFDKLVEIKSVLNEFDDTIIFNVPLIIGAETKLNENWTLRAGAKKAMWYNYIYKCYYKNSDGKIYSADDTYTISNTNRLNVNFGATFEIAAFSIDFLVNEDLILNGPEFISGRGAYGANTTPWASKIALNFKS